jgi:hypothetical protein
MGKDAVLWALGGLAGGLVVGAAVGAAMGSPAVAGAMANAGLFENVSAGSTLANGWIYYAKFNGPGAADVQSIASWMQSLGFVDPSSGGAPQITGVSATQATALLLFNGPIGTPAPGSTANLGVQLSGYPAPSVLSA